MNNDFMEGVLEKRFTDFVWCKVEMASIFDLAIPKHRIEYFKYCGEVIWSKKDRIDSVFGSVNGAKDTIVNVISRHLHSSEDYKRERKANTSNDDEENEIKNKRATAPRPTHFICIPISNPEIIDNVKTIHKHITKSNSLLTSSCSEIKALHVSLVMIRCSTPESIQKAIRVFKQFSLLLNAYLPREVLLTFQGIKTFHNRVLYTQPFETSRLTQLVEEMKRQFVQNGISLVGNHDPFQAHMTLLNMNRSTSRMCDDGVDYTIYSKYADMVMGSSSCTSIEFCEMSSEKEQFTKFYNCLCSVSNLSLTKCVGANSGDTYTASVIRSVLPSVYLQYGHDHGHEIYVKNNKTHNASTDNPSAHCDSREGAPSRNSLQDHHSNGDVAVVLILRGLPGCGKSTFVQFISEYISVHCLGLSCVKVSADDFVPYGKGDGGAADEVRASGDADAVASTHQQDRKCMIGFNKQDISMYHKKCTLAFTAAMNDHINVIIVDNTNIKQADYELNIQLAKENNYLFKVIDVMSSQIHSVYDAIRVGSRNIHHVEKHTLLNMWSKWECDPASIVVHHPLQAEKKHNSSLSCDQMLTRMHSQWTSEMWNSELKSLCNELGLCIQYIGVVLNIESRQRLLHYVYPRHESKVRGHHVPLYSNTFSEGGNGQNEDDLLVALQHAGRVLNVRLVREFNNSLCQVVQVEVEKMSPKGEEDTDGGHLQQSYITISHDESVVPKYAISLMKESQSLLKSTEDIEIVDYCNENILPFQGLVTLCLTSVNSNTTKGPFFISHPSDLVRFREQFAALSKKEEKGVETSNCVDARLLSRNAASTSLDVNRDINTSRKPSFNYSFLSNMTRNIYVFDFDDTLFHTPSKVDYELVTGMKWKKKSSSSHGWYCSSESLSLDLPITHAPALVDLHNYYGRSNSVIILLTGRAEHMKKDIEKILKSRNILHMFDEVICKPTVRESTDTFKAEYIVQLGQFCVSNHQEECNIFVWDDKQENLDCIENKYLEFVQLNTCEKMDGKRVVTCPRVFTNLVGDINENTYSTSCLDIRDWAYSSGQLSTPEFEASSKIALKRVLFCWHKTRQMLSSKCPVLSHSTFGTSHQAALEAIDLMDDNFMHIVGSSVFGIHSDIDIVLINDTIDAQQKMPKHVEEEEVFRVFLSNLDNFFPLEHRMVHTGNGAVLSVAFVWDHLPCVDIDISLLNCVSVANTSLSDSNASFEEESDYFMSLMLCQDIRNAERRKDMSVSVDEALHWTIEDYANYEDAIEDINNKKVLYGVCVRNSCLKSISAINYTPREFGAILLACRRVAEINFCTNGVVVGIRSFLLALSLVAVIDSIGNTETKNQNQNPHSGISFNDLFILWCEYHHKNDIYSLRQNIYPSNVASDFHVNRLHKGIVNVYNTILGKKKNISPADINWNNILNVKNMPDCKLFSQVNISCSVASNGKNGFSTSTRAANVYTWRKSTKGLLCKYLGRLIRDGHHLIMVQTSELVLGTSPSCGTSGKGGQSVGAEEAYDAMGRDGGNSMAEDKVTLHSFYISKSSTHVLTEDWQMKLKKEILSSLFHRAVAAAHVGLIIDVEVTD